MEDMWKREGQIKRDRDAVTPCLDVPAGPVSLACWSMAAARAVAVLHLSVPEIGKVCRQARVGIDRRSCYSYVGQQLLARDHRRCQRLGGGVESYRACINGVFGSGAASSTIDMESIVDACTATPAELKQSCVREAAVTISFTPKRDSAWKLRQCESFSGPSVGWCVDEVHRQLVSPSPGP